MLPMKIIEVIINKFPLRHHEVPHGQIMTTMSQLTPWCDGSQKSFDSNCKTQRDFRNLDKICIFECNVATSEIECIYTLYSFYKSDIIMEYALSL